MFTSRMRNERGGGGYYASPKMKMKYWVVILLTFLLTVTAHKKVVDFDDSDMERLFQQWEVG